MVDYFLEFHKKKPVMVDLPNGEKMEVFITDKNVMDDYSKEYYLSINIPNRQNYNKLSDKMIEHYVYSHIKSYLKIFSIDGNIYLKFNYL